MDGYDTDQELYERALRVISRIRRGESLARASRRVGISSTMVRRYARTAFTRDWRGRWHVKPVDRLERTMRWLDHRGLTTVEPADSTEATKVSKYWQAVDHFLLTGDDRLLRRFRHMRLRTRHQTSLGFITDPDLLERLAYAGQLSFEEMYEH
jgi:hypothetical protein